MPTFAVSISLLAIYLIWGSTFAAIKLGIAGYPPFALAAVRFTLAGIILFIIAYYKKTRILSVREISRSALIGFLLTFSNALVCWAQKGLDSGIAALIITSVPVFLVGLNTFAYERRSPSFIALIGLAVSISGLFVIFYPALFTSGLQSQLPFMLLLVISSFTWANGSLLQKTTKQNNPIPFFQNLAIQVFSGGLGLFVISYLMNETIPNPLEVSWLATGAAIYLAVFGTVLAYSCYIYCLRHATAELVSTYALVNPVIAIMFGVVFLNEIFTIRLAYASVLVLSGVALIIFEPKLKSVFKKIFRNRNREIEKKQAC